MFYLITDPAQIPETSKIHKLTSVSYNDIYITKEEKIRCIKHLVSSDERLLKLLTRIYPELTNIDSYRSYWPNRYFNNDLLLGLSLQACIGCIENPNIIYTSDDIDDAIPLQYNFAGITQITHMQYNGNYCLLIGKAGHYHYVLRVFLSQCDKEFIPEVPEFILHDSSDYWLAHTTSFLNEKHKITETNARVIFLHDFQLDQFLNEDHCAAKTIYIKLHSFEYKSQIKTIKEVFSQVIFIIDISEFKYTEYSYIDDFTIGCLKIIISSSDNLNNSLYEPSCWTGNFLIEKQLMSKNSLSRNIIDFKTFGLVKLSHNQWRMGDKLYTNTGVSDLEAFAQLRKQFGLPTLKLRDHDSLEPNNSFQFQF